MKSRLINRPILIGLTCLSVLLFSIQVNGQNKLRIKAYYVKVMGQESHIDISATSKIDKKNVYASNINLIVYNEIDDEKIELGKVLTNMNGKTKFSISDFKKLKADSTGTYNLLVSYKGDEIYKKARKRIAFKDASIEAKLVKKDSINYVSAVMKEMSTDSVMVKMPLTIQVQRLFNPLVLVDEFNYTDDNGTIFVPIEDGIPGVDGKLVIEVVLKDSDDYGTVKALVHTDIGTPIVNESDFDSRQMWSSRDKTPIFMLIFPNLVIFGIWALLIFLIINLFKISKS